MATTIIPFLPNASPEVSPPFSTIVSLDGVGYNLFTVWSIYRNDWYFGLVDQSGNVAYFAPLIGSPPNFDIVLAPGLFTTSKLVFREATQNFEIS